MVKKLVRMNFNPLPSHEGRLRADKMQLLLYLISIHSPLTRGDIGNRHINIPIRISIHSPLTRGDFFALSSAFSAKISIHSPLTRGDPIRPENISGLTDFNPLPSHEGRPGRKVCALEHRDFNPLPSHEGRLVTHEVYCVYKQISIHSPLTRGDPFCQIPSVLLPPFQSTPLSRGETHEGGRRATRIADFNPLPSHEGRHYQRAIPAAVNISIHSPLTRGDQAAPTPARRAFNFNPLPSHEGRLYPRGRGSGENDFNPLPSHEGRRAGKAELSTTSDFNPLPSHEGRHIASAASTPALLFQSTPLSRGETAAARRVKRFRVFQSTPLSRGETQKDLAAEMGCTISIHSPLTRGDNRQWPRQDCHMDFNPLPSHEGRPRRRSRHED